MTSANVHSAQTTALPTPDPLLDLTFERDVDLDVQRIWEAWTTPEHILHWFTPAPWKTTACDIDLRPGGKFSTTMESPEGQQHANIGCFLEVQENRRLVWTDALGPGYRPKENGFVTAIISLEPIATGTRYMATAIHQDEATRQRHEAMGFRDGWGKALDQLVAYMKTIRP
ncbi:MAG: SRPBCC family protein [Janthinobacterium lividum]